MRRSRSSALGAGRVRGAALGLLAALVACGSHAAPPAAPPCDDHASVTLARQADVAHVAGCAVLGALTIRSGAPLDLAPLAHLRQVASLTIGPTVSLDSIALPGLQVVTGPLRIVGNGLAQGVFLRQLARAGELVIDGNPALTTIALPALTTAASLRVTDNASLELLDLAALDSLGAPPIVTGSPRLTVVDAKLPLVRE